MAYIVMACIVMADRWNILECLWLPCMPPCVHASTHVWNSAARYAASEANLSEYIIGV